MSHMKAKHETNASSHGRKRVSVPKSQMPSALAKLSHITKLMALALRLEHLLATDIQQAILDLEPTTDPVPRFREREVRTIAIIPNWEKQRLMWKRLIRQTSK